jgi:hypothetical protein
MKQFKVRASTLGVICAVKGFAKTGEACVEQQVLDMIYERRHDVKSKYLSKGNDCEQQSVNMLNEMLGLKVEKNTERFFNEFITGEPDYIQSDFVRDIKNSYSHGTFPLFGELDYKYKMQLKGYLWLLGMKKGSVDYFLHDMPENLLMKECRAEMWNRDMEELEVELYDEIKAKFTYSDLPLNLRYRSFEVELTDQDIEFMKANVSKANDYGNALLREYYGEEVESEI